LSFKRFLNLFLGQTNSDSITDSNNKLNRNNLSPIIITILSTFVLTLMISTIFVTIFIWRRKRLQNNLNNRNDEKHEYDDINNEYVINDAEYELVDYENINYDNLNYDELNVEQNNNQTHNYIEIIP